MPRQQCAVSSCQAHPGLVVLVAVLDAPPSTSAGCITPVAFAVYVAVAVSAAITIAAADVFSAGPFVDCCCAHHHRCCHSCLHRHPLSLPSPIIRDSKLIGVNNFAIHTVILYFTASTDKPTLNQIYIAGGHLDGGGSAGNDGSDEGQWRRAGVAGQQALASAATVAAGVALEKRRRSAGGSALAACYYVPTYLLCEKSAPQKCSANKFSPLKLNPLD
jgi:hypothetical protein